MCEILAVGSDCPSPLRKRVEALLRSPHGQFRRVGNLRRRGAGDHAPRGGWDGYEGWITGTRVYAADVIEAVDRLGSEADVARELGLSEHQVRVAVEWDERRAAGS